MAKHDASDTARKGGKSPEASMLRIGTGCGRMGGGHSVWPVPDGGGAQLGSARTILIGDSVEENVRLIWYIWKK